MIRIVGLKKRYMALDALKGIDLETGRGELFAYLGPNGAGKTTTIRIATGLTRPTEGRVFLGDYDITQSPLAAKRQLGLVPQSINLDSELSVFEHLHVHGRLHGMAGTESRRRIDELLDYIELTDNRRAPVGQLSGGMKRRVMIARALLHAPRILFLDEPTVGLDPAIRRRLWALIKNIQADGVTIFLTTHYIEEAEFLADRVAFIDGGVVVAADKPAALMNGIGRWAADIFEGSDMQTSYFPDRDSAGAYVSGQNSGATLRRVNLEDAFLSLTGKKVA